MYDQCKTIPIPSSVSSQVKNLQVVSFDSEWREVYIGYIRKDVFTGECPNEVNNAAKISVKYNTKDRPENAVITAAKWCPMESCTLLVLGCQYGIQIYDWDGRNIIYDFDFVKHGIGSDDKQITGPMAKGIAALGSSYVVVGLHTGEILMFSVSYDEAGGYQCRYLARFRQHLRNITDLASSTTSLGPILASGDITGDINIWSLDTGGGEGEREGLLHRSKIGDWSGHSVTTLAIWSKFKDGVLIAAYGSGHIRLFSLAGGNIICEVSAHNGWITGMDLASQSGLLLTSGEDSYVRVWQLATKGPLLDHWFSSPLQDCLMAGAKFLDPRGSSFCVSSYDCAEMKVFAM